MSTQHVIHVVVLLGFYMESTIAKSPELIICQRKVVSLKFEHNADLVRVSFVCLGAKRLTRLIMLWEFLSIVL